MLRVLLARLGLLVAMVWTAATVNFIVPHLTSRDPIADRMAEVASQGGGTLVGLQEMVRSYNERFGLDRPLWDQYLLYMNNLLHFDLGFSITSYPQRVADEIAYALPWTIGLLGTATVIAFVLGTTLGALAAWPRSPPVFRAIMPAFMVLSAIPFYLVGLVLIYSLAFRFNVFPNGGGQELAAQPGLTWSYVGDVLYHSVLPAISIVLASIGFWGLGMRGMMITVQGEDYMVFADAKGLKPSRVFLGYAMRNAILPQVTTLALSFGRIISGSVLVEIVFAYPGIGTLLFQAIKQSDYFTIYGCVIILVLATGISMILVDLLYPLLDPRVRHG
jgi:peptide/nickel transport system permease protein